MENKTRLQTNNTDLQEILQSINNLPIASSGGDTNTTDATAIADDIIQGKTAYVNGKKIIGTMVVQSYYLGDTTPSASLGNNGDLFLIRGE